MFRRKFKKFKAKAEQVAREEARLLYRETGYDVIALSSHPGATLRNKPVTSTLVLKERLAASKPLTPVGGRNRDP